MCAQSSLLALSGCPGAQCMTSFVAINSFTQIKLPCVEISLAPIHNPSLLPGEKTRTRILRKQLVTLQPDIA